MSFALGLPLFARHLRSQPPVRVASVLRRRAVVAPPVVRERTEIVALDDVEFRLDEVGDGAVAVDFPDAGQHVQVGQQTRRRDTVFQDFGGRGVLVDHELLDVVVPLREQVLGQRTAGPAPDDVAVLRKLAAGDARQKHDDVGHLRGHGKLLVVVAVIARPARRPSDDRKNGAQ